MSLKQDTCGHESWVLLRHVYPKTTSRNQEWQEENRNEIDGRSKLPINKKNKKIYSLYFPETSPLTSQFIDPHFKKSMGRKCKIVIADRSWKE